MTPRKVLITGATGFLGTRLCERMRFAYGMDYRAMVRSWTRANRIARIEAEMVEGDLSDPASIDRALEGCDAVAHLAFRDGAKAAKETRALMDACRRHGVRHVVHVSSMSVHGPFPEPHQAHESTATLGRYGEGYSDAKVAQEREAQRAYDRHGLPVTILRPTLIYGPTGFFATLPIQLARTGRIPLVDGGAGICNAVFVDDVCDAIHVAMTTDAGVGRAFFINGDDAPTWREFTLTFADLSGCEYETRDYTTEELKKLWMSDGAPGLAGNLRALAKMPVSAAFLELLSTVPVFDRTIRTGKRFLASRLDEKRKVALRRRVYGVSVTPLDVDPWRPPDVGRLIRESVRITFSNQLAKDTLGWAPAYDFARGVDATAEWLRFAKFIPATAGS